MRKNVSAFTVVELLVVISIIGVLATITLVSFGRYQSTSRDTQRSSKATILSEALEKYYDKNGEYPSCGAMTGTANSVATTVLPGLDQSILVTPKSTGSTNSFACQDLTPGGTDVFAYTGGADVSPACTGSGTCTGFALKYLDESDGTVKTISSRRAVAATPTVWTKISSGYAHNCAINAAGIAYCWGDNTYGQLGNNSTTASSKPVAVNTGGVLNGLTILSISAGGYTTCAVASDGNSYCWGYNGYGSIGNNTTTNSSVPVAVNTAVALVGKTLTTISTGGSHTCALDSVGKVYCWGRNVVGALGNNSTTDSSVPVAVKTDVALLGKTVAAISVSDTYGAFSCALDTAGKGYCWGSNFYGQIGDGTGGGWSNSADRWVPTPIYTGGALLNKTLTAITAGNIHGCAIDTAGKAYCWGGFYGPDLPTAMTSGALPGKILATIVAGQSGGVMAADTDGQSYSWDPEAYPPMPSATTGLLGEQVTALSYGNSQTCAITTAGKAYCWNGTGPVRVPEP